MKRIALDTNIVNRIADVRGGILFVSILVLAHRSHYSNAVHGVGKNILRLPVLTDHGAGRCSRGRGALDLLDLSALLGTKQFSYCLPDTLDPREHRPAPG